MIDCVVRTARVDDAQAIAVLLPMLGYEPALAQVEHRLHELLRSSQHAVFVAQTLGVVVGLCLVASVRHLASSGYAEVMELVVHAQRQRQGVGSLLLAQVQVWASHQGHTRVRLRSGRHRSEAHAFYERLGYAQSGTSYAFERNLAEVGPGTDG